ncbi:Protein LONGIFOLIA 2 [Linum grandiflorum]
MAAKLLHSLADDHQSDLQKRIGCVTGIFQIFDRQQMISHNKFPPDRMIFPETPSRDSVSSQPSTCSYSERHSNMAVESLRVLSRIRELPWCYNNGTREHARPSCESKDSPRFSYDSNRLSFESQKPSGNLINRPPSVVAKLMGLDTLPQYSASASQSGLLESRTDDSFSSCFKLQSNDANADVRIPNKSSRRVPTHNSSPSVYSEIEKRLKDLEFKHSGKDLRALKQILEAMQAKGLLETRPEFDQNRLTSSSQRPRFPRQQSIMHGNVASTCTTRAPNYQRSFESPIVIMKPAKVLVEKSGIPSRIQNGGYPSSRGAQAPSKPSARESTSPRLHRKNVDMERRSRSPTPPSDSRKPIRQSRRNPSESSSPGGKCRMKCPTKQHQNHDQLSQISNESRETNSKEALNFKQPSPVSVLDHPVYKDDECGRWKLKSIENLVQKLRRLNSTHDEASTDYIANTSSPDHRYISKILLASGLLLRDLTTFQMHASGYPINPQLFYVLEQTTKDSNLQTKETCYARSHRKLIFDAVNEILTKKLMCYGRKKTITAQKLLKELCWEIDQQLQVEKVECSSLEDEDGLKVVTPSLERWTQFDSEVSGLVLDVERLVFKDLVDEIVMGEEARSRSKLCRRRQLFAK